MPLSEPIARSADDANQMGTYGVAPAAPASVDAGNATVDGAPAAPTTAGITAAVLPPVAELPGLGR